MNNSQIKSILLELLEQNKLIFSKLNNNDSKLSNFEKVQ